jgi:hypothetical protein
VLLVEDDAMAILANEPAEPLEHRAPGVQLLGHPQVRLLVVPHVPHRAHEGGERRRCGSERERPDEFHDVAELERLEAHPWQHPERPMGPDRPESRT